MKNTVKKAAEVIPVGTERDDVKVWLVVNGPTETVVRVMTAIGFKNNAEAKARAEAVRNQEVLCLRKVGYGLAGELKRSIKIINWRFFLTTDYTFQWTDWKYKTMKMVKPT
ncbi:MAG: hypothetical protein D4Q79_00165 [Spirochaetia bacterium]|nr:MAG: hypothetical protein D4Q79_00165 [Spirochaetia bacterium]